MCGIKLIIHYQTSTYNKVNEWISTFIPHFTGRVIGYPCWDDSQLLVVLVQGAPGNSCNLFKPHANSYPKHKAFGICYITIEL